MNGSEFSMVDAFEHMEWTIERSPKTALMFKERFEALKRSFDEAIRKAENATN